MSAILSSAGLGIEINNDFNWQFLSTNNVWQNFEAIISNNLEQSLTRGETTFDLLRSSNEMFRLNFCESTMKRNGDMNSLEIRIRRKWNRNYPNSSLWEWIESGYWVEYELNESEHMSLAYSAGLPQIRIYNQDRAFIVDFQNMIQRSCLTGFTRGIRVTTPHPFLDIPKKNNDNEVIADYTDDLKEVLRNSFVGTAPPNEECVICFDHFSAATDKKSIQLSKCGPHFYHKGCIAENLKRSGKCAVCKIQYISCVGNQPDGDMTHTIQPPGRSPLEGFPHTIGTIVIRYSFPGGIQGANHPNPGVPYSPDIRQAYLPDTPEGRECLHLLEKCFRQKLTFTIGRSLTTNYDNVIIWNGVHHKTSTRGGVARYGWPDDTYFERVKQELQAKGIVL